MSQSLYTSMSGLTSAQSQLNVVANNIANLNTTGFKSSNVVFEDLFYATTTSGNAPSSTTGGKNPIQTGLGVQVSSIGKNFTSGTFISTGRTTDMMISGSGFFTVQSATGELYLTRDGSFSFDAKGDLVTSDGYKVLGAHSTYSTSGSDIPVHVPQSINATVSANSGYGSKALDTLNDCQLTKGTFTINVTTGGGANIYPVTVTLTDNEKTMNAVATKVQGDLNAALETKGLPANAVTVSAVANDGRLTFDFADADIDALTFSTEVHDNSNFVIQTEMGSAVKQASSVAGRSNYQSKILDYNASLSPVTSATDAATISAYSIGEDGVIEATYSNGGKFTVENNGDGTYGFRYTTNTGVIIDGTNVKASPAVAVPENMVMQIATVVNVEGLTAKGSNLYMTGPNCGQMIFTVGGATGLGSIQSGGLEASNVDLAQEFSNMILAQRAIQANSRVFDTTSNVMQQLAYLGRG